MSDPTGLGSNPLIPDDRFVRNAVRTAVHVRRHLPLYIIGLAVLLVAALVPTVTMGGSGPNSGLASGSGVAGTGQNAQGGSAATGVSGSGAVASSGSGAGSSGIAGSGASASGAGGSNATGSDLASGGPAYASSSGGGPAGRAVGAVQAGTGTTIAGFQCAAGVRQIPWSSYAAPCINHYTGYNGGSTYRGVTPTQIIIADRDCPQSANSEAVNQFAQAAGAASQSTADQVQQTFINYFNKVFDLYGRHVTFVKTPVSGSSQQCTLEAEYQGQDNACADADNIANSIHAYGEDGLGLYAEGAGGGGSGPFSECAAQRHLVEFSGGAYFAQSWYNRLNPYVWNTTMGCDRIGQLTGESTWKNYGNLPAKWAGDPVIQKEKRVYGIYVPNNPSYTECTKVSTDEDKAHGVSNYHEYDYVLDVSRFADQASQAIVQFHAEGVTTVVLACDPISPIFLTQAADGQKYYPEWYEIGTALNDVDTIPRLWDSKEITGHLFGLSELGPSQALTGPLSEPGITYKHITGKDIPMGSGLTYFQLVAMYSLLQAAGPVLTPQNMARGAWALPEGGALSPGGTKYAYSAGAACYCTKWQDGSPGTDHTAVEDARFVYWNAAGTSLYDGKTGTYIPIWRGARYKVGEVPQVEPPFYPPSCNPSCKTPPPDQPPPPGPHDGG